MLFYHFVVLLLLLPFFFSVVHVSDTSLLSPRERGWSDGSGGIEAGIIITAVAFAQVLNEIELGGKQEKRELTLFCFDGVFWRRVAFLSFRDTFFPISYAVALLAVRA